MIHPRALRGRAPHTLLVLAALLFLAPPALAAESASVLKDGATLRSGPGESKEILWQLFKGYPVLVTSRKDKWVQVTDFEGDKGWILASLLAKKKTVIVKSDKALLRVGPGQDYEVVAAVRYGVVLEPVERERDWIKVRHQDATSGWIHAKLVWPN